MDAHSNLLNDTWPRNYKLTDGSNSYETTESYNFGYGPAPGSKNYGATISELLDRYTSAGDTIAIQGNIDVSQPIVITKELTFDMSNGSLTAVRQLKNNQPFQGNDIIHFKADANIPTFTIRGGMLNTNGNADRAITANSYAIPHSNSRILNLDGTTINSNTNGIYCDDDNSSINLINGATIHLNNSDGYAIGGDFHLLELSGSSTISGTYKNAVKTNESPIDFYMLGNSKITGTATGNVIDIPSASMARVMMYMRGNSFIDVNLSAIKNTDLTVFNIDNSIFYLYDNATISAKIIDATLSTSAEMSAIRATGNSQITLSGANNSVNLSSGDLKGSDVKAYTIFLDKSNLNINAGKISNSSYNAANVKGSITLPKGSGVGIYSYKGGNDVNIVGYVEGGNVSDNRSVGIYLDDSDGTVNIKDNATVSGSVSGVEVKAGTLNVTGGTIKSYTTSEYSVDKTATKGAAIGVTPNSDDSKIDVNFSGATTNGCKAIVVSNPDDVSSTDISVDVTG